MNGNTWLSGSESCMVCRDKGKVLPRKNLHQGEQNSIQKLIIRVAQMFYCFYEYGCQIQTTNVPNLNISFELSHALIFRLPDSYGWE